MFWEGSSQCYLCKGRHSRTGFQTLYKQKRRTGQLRRQESGKGNRNLGTSYQSRALKSFVALPCPAPVNTEDL